MKNTRLIPLSLIAVAVMAGCSSLPANNSVLERARSDYSSAQANPQVTALAPVELKQAGDSLDAANSAWSKRDDDARVNHLAYIAKQHVAIAEVTASQKAAEMAVANAGAERDRVRLEARTAEADAALRSAAYARQVADASLRNAEASQRNADAADRNAEALRRQTEASLRSAEAAQRQADAERLAASNAQSGELAARQQALNAENRTRALEAQLNDLQAKKTERGMVITLGDVLFDTNEAKLKSGGMHNVQKLAEFFKQYPQRNVLIEGFTDSTGSDSHNMVLSENRALSVRTALMDSGMGSARISSRGYGEAYPVAGNDTASGRQLNRRVEIVVSNDNATVAPR